MNNQITYKQVISRLLENRIAYSIRRFSDCLIIVSEHGGRVFGPFESNEAECLNWLNKGFRDANEFRLLVESRSWNIGGERFWVAPEFAFFVKVREKFDDTYVVQDAMGAGNYKIKDLNNAVQLSQIAELEAFELPFKSKKVYMERTISEARNPFYDSVQNPLPPNTSYCGYHQTFLIRDESPRNSMYMEPWVLNQINPGGKLLIPYFGSFEFVDYYDPVDSDCQRVNDGFAELNITGNRKYKVAYKAVNTFGRSVYVNRLSDGRYYAHIRNYNNDPSNPYCCEPADKPGEKGCSLFVYNDFGGHGGFAEYEHSGLTLGMDTGKNESACELTDWWFISDKANIEAIVWMLLGIKYAILF